MKRSFFAILALCVITVGLVGCGGGESDLPEGYTDADVRDPPETLKKSPSDGVGERVKPN